MVEATRTLKTPRLVKIFVAVLGILPFLPLLGVVLFLVFAHNIPERGFVIGAFGALMAAAFLWFWFRAEDSWTRGICVVVVTAAALGASSTPESLHGSYLLWVYPAIVIGFALRPLRAAATTAGLALLIAGLVVIESVVGGLGTGPMIGAALPPLAVLALGSWAAITVSQLLWNTADLHAAREELARLAVEEERARFSRDLHDLLGHTLSLIVVKLELAGKLLPSADSPAGTELREIEQIAREALRDVREVAGGYRQPTLAAELAGAGVALEAAGIKLTLAKDVGMLPSEVEATLAWAVREGVTNVVRHSGARVCKIRIGQRDGRVTIEVSDDGRGPDSSEPGMGLTGLRERVEKRGGTVDWRASTPTGFVLSAAVPLKVPA